MTTEEFRSKCDEYSNCLVSFHEAIGTYVMVSPNCQKITEFEPQEVIGRGMYDFIAREDMETVQQLAHLPAIEGETTSISAYRFLRKDGSYAWLHTEFQPIKNEAGLTQWLLSISRDISHAIEVYQQSKRKESLFDAAGNLAKLGAWELDVVKNEALWSKTVYDIYEVDYDFDVNVENAISYFAEEAKPKIITALETAISKGTRFDLILPFITASNKSIYVRAIGKPVMEYGKVVKIYGTFQNISEQINHEKHQSALITQLTGQKQQLMEINHIISHNIRGPINSLNVLVDMVNQSNDINEIKSLLGTATQAFDMLNVQLEDLTKITNLLHQAEITVEQMSICSIIEKVKLLLESLIEKEHVTITYESEWDEINYYRLYLESILMNLIENAIKYRSCSRDPKIEVKTWTKDHKKYLSVSDNGSGIDMEKNGQKVFRMNQIFHHEKPGRGLGLFMVKNQVEALGGQITLESEPDKGSTFTICF